jgi:Protein of unknown function (DUF3631)/CHC2 zinc finger
MRSAAWDAWVAKARGKDILDVARARPDLKLKSGRKGKELVGPCPECGGEDRFAVTSTARKKVFRCRGCGTAGDVIKLVMFLDGVDFAHAVEKLTGAPPPKPEPKPKAGARKIVATYPYVDETGKLLFEVVRYQPKGFSQRRPDGKGGWIPDLDGVRLVPYRLPQVLAAAKSGATIFVVEGEKDVATAEALGLAATTSPGGIAMGWRDGYDQHFVGADVVVIPDNDADPQKGGRHARNIANHLLAVARRVRFLTLPTTVEDRPVKDLSAFVAAGGTRDNLDALIGAAPDHVYTPIAEAADYVPPEVGGTPPPGAGAIDDDAEIEQLARLAPLAYERARKSAGERLGIKRLALLDSLVKAKRGELGLEGGNNGQGRALEFPAVEPWGERVDGAALLNALAYAIRRHVVMSFTASHVAALWVMHCWLINCFVISPRLGIKSATKGCGKTLLLDVLGRLVLRPLRTLSITPAATFRVVESHQPTLLIDEADTFLHDNEGLRGILDGNRKGDTVTRTVGDNHETRVFATYSAVAIALIGALPDTLHDRSVVIDLKRRLPKEKIAPFRFDRADHLDVLARMAARWAADNAERVAATDPKLPRDVINREADNWRPLAMVAEVAAGRWPARVDKAAGAAHGAAAIRDDSSLLEMLLADIRDVLDDVAADTPKPVDEMASAALVEKLIAIEGRPWAEMGKNEKPITPQKLADLLKRLKPRIGTKKIGPKGDRKAGYLRADFKEAFERYLGGRGDSRSDGRTPCDEMGTSCTFRSDTLQPGCPTRTAQKPNKNGQVSDRPTRKGGNGQARASDNSEPCAGRSPERASDPAELCAYCRRPGGNEVTFGAGFIRLHRDCEQPWIENRMAEEGIWRA